MAFTQTGENGIQAGHVDTLNANIQIVLPVAERLTNGAIKRANNALSKEFYCLFVVGDDVNFDETYTGSFLVDDDRALERSYTDEAIRDRFVYLNEEDREIIKTFPALFMHENHKYGSTDEEQNAYFGRITEIRPHGQKVKVKYHIISSIPQQQLNKLLDELCLHGTNKFNELNRMHGYSSFDADGSWENVIRCLYNTETPRAYFRNLIIWGLEDMGKQIQENGALQIADFL